MEQTPYRRRPTRPKLKMPLIGNMLGGGNSNPNPQDGNSSTFGSKFTPWIIAIAVIVFGIDYFNKKTDKKRVFTGQEEVQEMAWNGKITNRWANVLPSDNATHYMVQLRDAKGQKQVIDLVGEKTNFGDFIVPNNTIIKKAGSLTVTVQRYFKKDTVITLKYSDN
jgi:hypothetical protein